MQLFDRATLEGARRTADGYMVADVRVARTGIQEYRAKEVGLTGDGIVKVYRPAEEVFSQDSMKSYAHRPLTNDHPTVLVDAKNWKKYAVGQTGDEVARDTVESGDFVRVSVLAMDEAAIKDIENGKRELSMGYNCDIDHTAGVTEDGQAYDAVQRNLRMNHLAIVSRARGGSELKIGDKSKSNTKESVMSDQTTNIVLDGVTVSLPAKDAANVKAIFDKQKAEIDQLEKDNKAAKDKAKADEDEKSKLQGEKAALEANAKDNALTDAKIEAYVTARDNRAAVATVLGDEAKDPAIFNDTAIKAAYDKLKATGAFDGLKQKILAGDGVQTPTLNVDDARAKARQEMMDRKANAISNRNQGVV